MFAKITTVLFLLLLSFGCTNKNSSNKFGENNELSWKLKDNTLIIDGNGEMPKYGVFKKSPPWISHKNQIYEVIIKNGITNISECSFY